MTNNEISLAKAIEALENNKLDAIQASFITSIRDYTKKELNKISSKQYELLIKCSRKA